MIFSSVMQYEDFAGLVELVSQQTVAAHKYNTVDNFIRFYRSFKKSRIDSLEQYFREYQPPITPAHYTCVGLAFELINRLKSVFSEKHDAYNKFYVVSCEEVIQTLDSYVENVPPDKRNVEKEHVLVCLKIQIMSAGKKRNGFLLLDPGYHISRVVTVMEDGCYPHTGQFMQSNDGVTSKEYGYTMASPNYVSWNVIETKHGIRDSHTSLVFTGSPFLSSVEVAERRNLVYSFKSLLQRDPKGRLLAGLYFNIDSSTSNSNSKLTLFYMENNNRKNVKLSIVNNMTISETSEIRECERQLELNKGTLIQKLHMIAKIIHDEGFIEQLFELEEKISLISAEN